MTTLERIDDLIAIRQAELDALHKVKALLEPPPELLRLAPPSEQVKLAVGRKARKHKNAEHKNVMPAPAAEPSPEPELFAHEIDGVDVMVTGQQQAFIEMLGEHDYVPSAMVLPIYDNNLQAFKTSVSDLRARLAAAAVQAQIVGYKSRGYRLEQLPEG